MLKCGFFRDGQFICQQEGTRGIAGHIFCEMHAQSVGSEIERINLLHNVNAQMSNMQKMSQNQPNFAKKFGAGKKFPSYT